MKPARATLARLTQDFVSFGGAGLLAAIGLMVAGTLAEGIGILLLVPTILGMFGPSHPVGSPFMMLPGGQSLPSMLAVFALLVAIRGIIVLARERLVSRLQVAFVEAVRLRLVERLTRTAWPRVAELSHARVVQALSAEIHQVGVAVNSLMAATAAVVIVAGTASLAMAVAPLAALIAFSIAGLSYFPMRRMLVRIRRLGETITHRHFGMTENAIDFLASLKPVAAEGTGCAYLKQQRLLSDAAIADRVAFASLHARARELGVGLTAIAAIALVGVGVAIGFPAPGLLALLLMLSRLSGPLGEVQRGFQQLIHSLPSYERLRELEDMLRPDPASIASAAAPADRAILSFERVSFSRGGRDMLLDFSLDIVPGAMVGIAGPSGVGKTTLLDLMAGVLIPDTGCIRRRSADRMKFANDLAYVGQDAVLSGRTLRENLSWSSDAVTPDMLRALHIVGAAPLLQRLGGLDAPLGERGAMISGGERQRVSLARALLRRPQLLLLDEALNAFDPDSERDILTTLAGLRPRPTIVIVAHRPEAFALCSQMIHLSRQRSPLIEEQDQAPHPIYEVSA
jgi:ABC-type multidrug transport system fused ATPase/permease subunit